MLPDKKEKKKRDVGDDEAVEELWLHFQGDLMLSIFIYSLRKVEVEFNASAIIYVSAGLEQLH